MPLIEQRRHAIGLADLLLYDSLIEDGILLAARRRAACGLEVSRTRSRFGDKRRDGGAQRALGSTAPTWRWLDGAV